MKSSSQVIQELISIKRNVTVNLKKNGFVPVRRNLDGTISVGRFLIDKNKRGLFFVKDVDGEKILDNINLPHSAAILANNLALGKLTEMQVKELDIIYGACLFDEKIYKEKYLRLKDKDSLRAELMNTKYQTARYKKEFYKNKIVSGFNKLIKIA